MLLIGKQVTAPADPLQDATVEQVFRAIINPKGPVAVLQQRLQAIKAIDAGQYRKLKTGLPYIVCARFHPRIRRKEHFQDTERFILDIDHVSEHGLSMAALRQQLISDPRVELMFASPGGDGLKVLFRLREKMTDSAYYAVFYKAFCMQIAQQYQLGGAVDVKTCDVSRCCFVSFDAEAYYQAHAEPVEAALFARQQSFEDMDRIERMARQATPVPGSVPAGQKPSSEPEADVLNRIKQLVGVRVRQEKARYIEQPGQLQAIHTVIEALLQEVGAKLDSSEPIHFGRQLRISAGPYWAEVNVFYGKKGVSVVGTTKTGSNRELCAQMVSLLKNHDFEIPNI